MIPVFQSKSEDFILYEGNSLKILPTLRPSSVDMVFADPPYFLSGGGISYQNGKVVCVDKGDWDKPKTQEEMDGFNQSWIDSCRKLLKPQGTIWVSGTYHNIFSVIGCLKKAGCRILNVITWQKPDPPENITHKFFTFSAEFIIWARKSERVSHSFNYDLMVEQNGGKQMTDVWTIPTVRMWEKNCGKHPTQKPLALLKRIIECCTDEGNVILDPFAGSGTTGIAANLLNRSFIGIEQEESFIHLIQERRCEIDNEFTRKLYRKKLKI